MQYANPPQPTLTFFPAVLKTLSHPYPSTRPLVYNYLLHHAEADPDTTLLSINTIQKSLSDSNPRVRAMALKTMAGIRVPMISQLVSLAIKKGASDLSPIVRKAAALACVKCVTLDANTRPQVEEYLVKLLADQQYYVAGAAVQAFMEICPEKLDMIHPVYRKLCKMVVDMDEWGQLAILRLMATYARKSFPRRTKRVKRAATREQKTQDFYEDLEPKEEQEQDFEDVEVLDPDLELLLKSVQPLLQSRNSAVIVSVARLYLYLSPTEHLPNAIGPLIALLRSPKDVQQVALYNIVQVCLVTPMHFLPYVRHFLIRTSEAPQSWRLKLEVLTLLFPYCEKSVQDLILAELEHFSKGHNADLVRESVRAIGRCSQASDAKTSRRCLSLLLKQIHSADSVLVGEAMEVVRHMIQRSPDEHRKTVVRLAKNLDSLTSPAARASIIWLVGEFAGTDPERNIAADVLRILVRNYADETDEVRAQIVLLAAKVYLHDLNAKNAKTKALDALKSPTEEKPENQVLSPPLDEGGFAEHQTEEEKDSATHAQPQEDTITLLYQHTMLLARYTPSYDLRDRARVYRALLALPTSTELASLLLLAPKPVPQAPSPSESHKGYSLGSASLVVGNAAGVNGLRGYEAIPDWVAEGDEPNAKLRDAGGVEKDAYQPQKTVSAGQMLDDALEADPGFKSNGRKAKTLDDWLDDEEDDEESEESESGSGSEESEEESEYETDEDEDAESGEEESESEDDEKAGLVR
jgi:AP-3 complex subunit beta